MCARLLITGLLICLTTVPGAVAQTSTSISSAQPNTSRTGPKMPESKPPEIKSGMHIKHLQENIDREMAEAIADGDIPGGVVLIKRFTQYKTRNESTFYGGSTVVFEKAYGNRSVEPTTETTTLDTIYDLASLTKSIATATSIMQLVEQGKMRLTDSVSKYIPEWKNTPEEEAAEEKRENGELPRDRESITIRHLLTHTSGLPSYVRFYEKFPEGHARKKIVADIAQVDLRGPVGGQFIYSDLGFIVLGDLVERVSGMPLDEYAKKNIFEPLRMTDTGFNPPADKLDRVAPTEWRATNDSDDGSTRAIIRGKVHDGNAFVQDGVSGHAGLFSTAKDIGIFCDMLLSGGVVQGTTHHILSPITIATMISNQARLPEGKARRGLGWDVESPYDSQKGELFQTGFGHTGFTGTSIWVVPEEKLSIIILTNHVHPSGKGSVVGLRARIANIVAGSIRENYKKDTSE